MLDYETRSLFLKKTIYIDHSLLLSRLEKPCHSNLRSGGRRGEGRKEEGREAIVLSHTMM